MDWRERQKMRKAVQKEQENRERSRSREPERYYERRERTERILTPQMDYDRGETTEFVGNERTQRVGVFSPFFNQDTAARNSGNFRSQDAYASTQLSQPYDERRPNLARLRSDAANTALVPFQSDLSGSSSKAANTALVPSQSALSRSRPDGEILSRSELSRLRSIIQKNVSASALVKKQSILSDLPGRSTTSFVPQYFIPEYAFEPEPEPEPIRVATRPRPPEHRELVPVMQSNVVPWRQNGGRSDDLGEMLISFNVPYTDEDFAGTEPEPTWHKSSHEIDEPLVTWHKGSHDQEDSSLQIRQSSHNVGAQVPTTTAGALVPRAGFLEERSRNETYLRHIRATVETSTDGMACSSSDAYPPPRRTLPTALPIAHSIGTNVNRPSHQPFSTLGSVCFFGERDEPMRRELTAIEKEKPAGSSQPPGVAVLQRTDQTIARRDAPSTVAQRNSQVPNVASTSSAVVQRQPQVQTVKKSKGLLSTTFLIDLFRRKKNEEDPDDRRRRVQRETKQAWRENNERRLAEAAAASLRRKNESPEQTERRLASQAVATAERREGETEDERAQRREADAASHSFDRSEETDAERAERLANQALRTREVRAAETDAERLQRVDNNANARRNRQATEINDRVREIQRVQGVLRDNDDETAINRHECGAMDVICPFCGSYNFPGENDQFTKCCRKGKLIIPVAPNEEYPQLLREMMSDPVHPDYKNFREHIRNYNSSVSFASMGAKTVRAPGHGPYCFKVHGSVYHKTSHVQTVGGNAPQYAQLYILDRATQVVQTAIQHPSNVNNIIGRVLYRIVDFMRKNNRLAATYRMMADVLKSEEEKARRTNTTVPTINMVMRRNRTSDARRYNLPLENEVAMVFVGENVGEPPFQRDIQIYPKNPTDPNHHFIKINILSANLDPMTYAILFPFGQPGWHEGMVIDGFKPSMLQYKQAQLAIRDTFNPIISAGRLTQQWIVDSYLQVEANNLNYIRYHQRKLRAEEYAGLRDYVNRRATEAGLRAGQPIILPSTFEGSPRNMRERLQDAMSIFAKFGAVDAFITFTANPAWPEIVNNLRPGEISSDRPDLVARVFNLKLKALIEDLTVNHALGRTVAYVYTIEFQKRGLPHAHILVVFAEADKFRTTDRIDEVVSAEIPDKNVNPELYRIVIKNMLHGPCGSKHPDAPCMEDGKCSKEFPKEFKVLTDVNKSGSGYGMYRRRDTKRGIMKSGTWLDNRYVVPYNKYLLLKYNAHINVEVCTSMKAVKYIYKYIYKGFDCANFAIGAGDVNDRDVVFDEINNFIDARYISAPEGMWRLLEHHMHGRSIPVIHLDVHLPNQQRLYYEEGQEDEALVRAEGRETKLTAWFKLNEADVNARQYRYTEIPEYYTFTKDGIWRPRQRGRVLPRIYSVSPSDQERFYLRILLLHVRGATSYEFLRTVNGTLYATFREGALHRQLISDDTEWHNLMQEAKNAQMPAQLRQTLNSKFVQQF